MNKQRTYLKDILARIKLIEEFTKDGKEAFLNSAMIQESTIRCYEVIGEIVKRVQPDLLATQSQIPWSEIAGFRDFLIHNYEEVKVEIVWLAVEEELEALTQAIQAMLEQLNKDEPES